MFGFASDREVALSGGLPSDTRGIKSSTPAMTVTFTRLSTSDTCLEKKEKRKGPPSLTNRATIKDTTEHKGLFYAVIHRRRD